MLPRHTLLLIALCYNASLMAMPRIATCFVSTALPFQMCFKKMSQAPVKQRKALYKECYKKQAVSFRGCLNTYVTPYQLQSDCSSQPLPLTAIPKNPLPNTEVTACISTFTDKYITCQKTLSKVPQKIRDKQWKLCTDPIYAELKLCSQRHLSQLRLVPPFERPALALQEPWTYPKKLIKVGASGHACIRTNRPSKTAWYQATINEVNDRRLKATLKISGKTYELDQLQFIPEDDVSLLYPEAHQRIAKQHQRAIAMEVAHLLKQKIPSRKKNPAASWIHSTTIKKNTLTITLNKQQTIIFTTVLDAKGKIEKLNCKVIGKVNMAYLPEICQRSL